MHARKEVRFRGGLRPVARWVARKWRRIRYRKTEFSQWPVDPNLPIRFSWSYEFRPRFDKWIEEEEEEEFVPFYQGRSLGQSTDLPVPQPPRLNPFDQAPRPNPFDSVNPPPTFANPTFDSVNPPANPFDSVNSAGQPLRRREPAGQPL